MPGQYEVLHLSRKIISANLMIWCSKMQPLSGNQRPDLPTSLMNMSLVLRLPREVHLSRSSSNVPRLPSFLEMLQTLTFCSLLARCKILRLSRRTTSERQKVIRTCGAFNILTSTCASRHNGVHFFDISTSKNSEPGVLYAFWLGNVLRATTACTFSTSQLPKMLRKRSVFNLFTSKRASRHNGVQLFISHLARWFRTRRFSEPTFQPSGATNHSKNTVFRDFPTFSRTCTFFLLTLSLLFSALLFSDSSHLCFFICPYCRKFDF